MAETKKRKVTPEDYTLEELNSMFEQQVAAENAKGYATAGGMSPGGVGYALPVKYNQGGANPQIGPKYFGDGSRPASMIDIPERKQEVQAPAVSSSSIPMTVPNYLPTDREIDSKLLDQLFRLNQEASQWSGKAGDYGEEAYRNPNRSLLKTLVEGQMKERLHGTFGDVAKKESVLGMPGRMKDTAVAGYTQAQADAEKLEAESQARFERLLMGGQADKEKAAEKKRKLMESAAFSLMSQS
jgi:hypothetical protein